MDDGTIPAEAFDAHRVQLRTVAHRLLGSPDAADAAMREALARLTDAGVDNNLGSWLTAVVARVCIEQLRGREADVDLSNEARLADSVGLALVIALEQLTPAERLTFVLRDLFAMPYDEIGPIVNRSPVAARQLADRARHLVHDAGIDF
ncbi:sigma factor-like helix-turn-helix DNA-binding protein [Amycolatopsis albispora]|uniref:sigma factor-like helix-turn-helix DNA-binding protein n=1 Tax=Amycolatopsis albispora TaxID=1804986 RepID=UPI000DE32746|nr:sigma factor-like helix-turn-helix DNA-binding protein [Amycolatopsis albispora]